MRLATIKAKRHFVQVGREMLGADPMPRSNYAALEKRERGFDSISRDHEAVLVPDVFVGRVIYGLAFRYLSFGKSRGVEDGFVGHDHINVFADVLLHDFANRFRGTVLYVDEFQIATALNDADHGFFVLAIVSGSSSVTFAADVGFVNLDCAVQHLVNFGHGESDAMAEIPCGLVTDSECALDLICAHSFFGFAEQKGSEKPFLQGKMRIVKDCAGRNGELVIAALAVEQLLCRGEFHGGHFAARALNTIGPAEADKQLAAAVIGVKHLDHVN